MSVTCFECGGEIVCVPADSSNPYGRYFAGCRGECQASTIQPTKEEAIAVLSNPRPNIKFALQTRLRAGDYWVGAEVFSTREDALAELAEWRKKFKTMIGISDWDFQYRIVKIIYEQDGPTYDKYGEPI